MGHLWFISGVITIIAVLGCYRRVTRARRPTWSENCIECGYSLSGLPEAARCPECGRVEPHVRHHPPVISYEFAMAPPFGVVLIAIICMLGPIGQIIAWEAAHAVLEPQGCPVTYGELEGEPVPGLVLGFLGGSMLYGLVMIASRRRWKRAAIVIGSGVHLGSMMGMVVGVVDHTGHHLHVMFHVMVWSLVGVGVAMVVLLCAGVRRRLTARDATPDASPVSTS